MPNLSTLSGRLLTQELGSEDSTVLFTNARREAAIFDAIREFADLTECHIRRSTLTIEGGTGEYDLHNSSIVAEQDFIRFANDQALELRYTDASSNVQRVTLTERTERWLDNHIAGWRDSTVSSGANVPEHFYRRTEGGRQYLGFYPIPSTGSSASMAVYVPYVAYPNISTASTFVPFTDTSGNTRWDLRPYHQGLVHYAAHQLEKLRKDTQASDRQFQKFLSYITRYLQSMRKKGGTALTYARSYFRRQQDDVRDPRV